ncbi:restriction endonuclease [Shouchella sp. 1P09AA]|uniref:restriction endonuclease n=1 Tax=unclassified Shouchella TaxID=2893065 RepID=UPI0039A0190D
MEGTIALISISLIILLIVIGWLWRTYVARLQTDVSKITIRHIDRMDGHAFEDYMAVVYAASGCATYQTKKSRDYGADLIVTDEDGQKAVIQLKRYGATLGLSSVQESYAAKAYYRADKAVVVTTAEQVTDSCWKLAAATNVYFLLRADIEEMTKLIKREKWDDVYWLLMTPHIPEKKNGTIHLDEIDSTKRKIQVGDYYLK